MLMLGDEAMGSNEHQVSSAERWMTSCSISRQKRAITASTLLCLSVTVRPDRGTQATECQLLLTYASCWLQPLHLSSIEGTGMPSLRRAAHTHFSSVSLSGYRL